MKGYKHSKAYYESQLKTVREKIKCNRDNLIEYLAFNTGRRTTLESNRYIMHVVDDLTVLGYNEKHYEAVIENIEQGFMLEGKS